MVVGDGTIPVKPPFDLIGWRARAWLDNRHEE